MRSRDIGLALLCGMLAPVTAARAASPEWELRGSASQGYDSNPLQLPDGNRTAGFTQLGLGSTFSIEATRRIGFFASADVRHRLHYSDLSDADTTRGIAETGMGLVLFERGERRLSAAVRGSYLVSRSTFVDPATGEVYVVSDPNFSASIPDRFDVDTAAVHLDLRLRVSRDLLLMLDSRYEQEDFVNDYGDVPSMESLDDTAVVVRPGARWQVSDRVRLDISAEWSNRRYRSLSALDESANLVGGTRREYRHTAARASVRIDPTERWSVAFGLGGVDRKDLYAGYYDSLGANGFLSVGWSPIARTRLQAHVSKTAYTYDRATLDNDPEGVLRGSDYLRASLVAERDLGDHMTAFVEGGTSRSDNPDILFAYRSNWGQTGLRFKL